MTLPSALDLVVIGGGPGGYVCAIRAAQLGLKVAVVEKDTMGGVCLNWGCIPTKALLTCAETYEKLGNLEKFGLSVTGATFDLGKMVDHSRAVSSQLTKGVDFLMKKNNVTVIKGVASFGKAGGGKHTIMVKGADKTETITAKSVVVATGASPIVLPGLDVDGKKVWTSKEAMMQRTCPPSLLVVGSGAIGLEFASFYAHLGTNVTIVELQNHLLPTADPYISQQLELAFKKRGIGFQLGRRVVASKVNEKGCHLIMDDGAELAADSLLLAIGVRGNTEGLGLQDLGVQTDKGRIKVDEHLKTNVPGIYAIGDVVDGPWLAHKASHEGILAAEHIAGGQTHALCKTAIPACVYSTPQIASIGLTEPEAKAKGHTLKTGVFPFKANGKALAMGTSDGGVKTIFDAKTGEFLGAHMIGASVTELVSTFSLVKAMEGTDMDLAQTIFPHPTLSEMLHESVLAAIGRGLHA